MKRALLFTALMIWSGLAAAVVYRWVGADGKVEYGDRPPDGVKAEIVEMITSHASATAPANPAPSRPSGGSRQAAENPDLKKEKEAVAADVAASMADQCTEAQTRYKQLIEGRHLYRIGSNGEREYLTAEELDSERLSQKQELDRVCQAAN